MIKCRFFGSIRSCLFFILIFIIFFCCISNRFSKDAFCDEIALTTIWSRGGKDDDNLTLKNPIGFCIEPKSQRLYIADTGNDRIVVINPDGISVNIFITEKNLKRPFDVKCSQDGLFYVSQMSISTIEIFNNKGDYIMSVPRGDDLQDLRPGRMDFDPNGLLVFADRAKGDIYILNKDGYIKHRIRNKDGGGLLMGVKVADDGKIFSAWAKSTPVKIFNPMGDMISSFGQYRKIESGFSFPVSLTTDSDGYIWLIDAFRHRVKVFRQDGEYIYQGDRRDMVFPIDLEFDKDGRLYILEKGEGRIRAFLLGL